MLIFGSVTSQEEHIGSDLLALVNTMENKLLLTYFNINLEAGELHFKLQGVQLSHV